MASIALAWLALLGGGAEAQELMEVAVVGVHQEGSSRREVDTLTADLVSALEQAGQLDPLTPEEVARRLQGRNALVMADYANQRGEAWLEEGRLLYERFFFDQASPVLQRAIGVLSTAAGVTGDVRPLAEAWLLLALSEAGLGNSEEAGNAFAQVTILQPERVLDPVSYPPKILSLFEEARSAVLDQDPALLRITGPLGVEIQVDGRDLGPVPVVTGPLPPGRHFVRAVGAGTARGSAQVRLAPGESSAMEIPMFPRGLPSLEQASDRARQTQDLYRALGQHCGCDLVLLAGIDAESRVTLQLYGTSVGVFADALEAPARAHPDKALLNLVPALGSVLGEGVALRPDRVTQDVASLQFVANPVLVEMLLDPQVGSAEATPEGRAGGFLEENRWVLWTGAGVLVAGGITAAVLVGGNEPGSGGTIVFGPIP